MIKLVSFFGDKSEIFSGLNLKAEQYAAARGIDYSWSPQVPYIQRDVIECLRQADAGIIDVEPYAEEIFKEIYSRTRLLVRFGVGYDKVDLAAASRYGIAIARTTGANTLGVAEMALTLILAARRKLKVNQKCVESGNWAKNVANETVQSTVGIVGFGNIGQALAGLLKGFNCRLITYDPFVNAKALEAKGVEGVTLKELFATSDIISLHLPISQETHHLVNAQMLSIMKPSAVIVNTARGKIIDEHALYEALVNKKSVGPVWMFMNRNLCL
jgi:D-3-phosphoglycerate dehydrogenase